MSILHTTDSLLTLYLFYVTAAIYGCFFFASKTLKIYSPTREYFLRSFPYHRWGVQNYRDGVRRRTSQAPV